MSNYKHFSKMYILVRVIALLFHCALSVAACVQNQVCEFSGESQCRNLCTSDSKMKIFPLLSNIYRWRNELLVKLSYAFRKRAHSSNSASLSWHTQPFCQSRFKLKCLSLLILTFNHMIARFMFTLLVCTFASKLVS